MKRILILASLLILCVPAAFIGYKVIAGIYVEKESKVFFFGRERPSGEQEVQERKPKIREELAGQEDHPWAGHYWFSQMLFYNESLLISPESGFVYSRATDYSLYHYNYGGAIWKDGRIQLSPVVKNDDLKEDIASLRTEFIPIPWGEERYLVPPEKMMAFFDVFNSGDYPGSSFLRKLNSGSQWREKLTGLPEVPEEYKKYLLKEALDAEILSVGEPNQNVVPVKDSRDFFRFGTKLGPNNFSVTLNQGSRDGLYPGMRLRVMLFDSDSRKQSVWNLLGITAVSETQAEGVLNLDENLQPQSGWRLSAPRRWIEDQMEEDIKKARAKRMAEESAEEMSLDASDHPALTGTPPEEGNSLTPDPSAP